MLYSRWKCIRGLIAVVVCGVMTLPCVTTIFLNEPELVKPVTGAMIVAGPDRDLRAQLKTEAAIDKGFQWLIQGIRRDGMVGMDGANRPDLSCTAMTGLAFLAEGSTPSRGRYAKECKRVLYGLLDMLEARSMGPGAKIRISQIQTKIGANADLFFAAYFLSQVYGEAPDDQELIKKALTILIVEIGRVQGPDGTWGNESWAPILGTVMGWESLRACSATGLKINASAKAAGDALLKKIQEKGSDKDSWMHKFYRDASSLRVLYSMEHRNEAVFNQIAEELIRTAKSDERLFQLAGGEEYLSFFLVTECFLKEPDRASWQPWYPNVREQLVKIQNRDGSWTGHHCITSRTFCTAAALMTLVADRQYLPSSDL